MYWARYAAIILVYWARYAAVPVAARNHGTYLSEQGCGVHFDGTIDHEVVIELWGGAICALATLQEREEVIELAERLAGPHGARVLVPDAHAALRVRRLRDVMLAHLRDDPLGLGSVT